MSYCFLYFRYFYRLALKQLTHHVISKRTLFGVDPTKILGGDRSKEYSETKVIGYKTWFTLYTNLTFKIFA